MILALHMVFSFVGGFDRGGVVLLLDYLEDLNKSIKKIDRVV